LDEDLLRNTLVKLLGAFKRNECFSAIKWLFIIGQLQMVGPGGES
jgi:hypothetical protein